MNDLEFNEWRLELARRWSLVILILTSLTLGTWYLVSGSLPKMLTFEYQGISIPTVPRIFDLLIWPLMTIAIIVFLFPKRTANRQKDDYDAMAKDRREIFLAMAICAPILMAVSLLFSLRPSHTLSLSNSFFTINTYWFLAVALFASFFSGTCNNAIWTKTFLSSLVLPSRFLVSCFIVTIVVYALFHGIICGLIFGLTVVFTLFLGYTLGVILRFFFMSTTYDRFLRRCIRFWQWLNVRQQTTVKC